MTPRKASKPAARTVKRTCWLACDRCGPLYTSNTRENAQIKLAQMKARWPELGPHRIVRCTYTIPKPRRTKR